MGYYSPTIWENLLNSDRSAWDSVKDEDVIEESRSECDRYSQNLMEQAFYGLYDPLAELSEMPPEGMEVESSLLNKAMEMDEYLSLRDEVYSDRMASMLATAAFSTELLSKLPEDVKKNLEEHQKAQQEANEKQSSNPESDEAKKAVEKAKQTLEKLQQSLERNQAQIENTAATAMEKTEKDIKDGKKLLGNLGFSPQGGKLDKTDVQNMRRLAELLKGNERLRKMIELIGSMEHIVSDEMKKSVLGKEQLVDYQKKELDLENLAPEEFIGLGAPQGSAVHTDFMIRLANNELLHCRYEGEAPEGRGPIIILKDTSGSMDGERLEFANALEFAVMTRMMKEMRKFISIPFSGSASWYVYEPSGRPSLDEILNHLSVNYNGGTDPYPPLTWAIDRILEKQDMKKAGILIITDGEFEYPEAEFMEKLNAARENPGVMIHSIVIGCEPYGLREFADRIVSVEDLSETGKLNAQVSESLRDLI